MTTVIPSRSDRKTLIIGASVVVLLLVGGRMARVRDWIVEQVASARELAQAAARAEHSVRDQATTRALQAEVSRRLATYDSAFVDGATPAVAGASLAVLISDAAHAAEAELASVQLQPATESRDTLSSAAFGHVVAKASVTGDLESIALFLEGLEAGPQLVAVRELSITQPETNLPPTRKETLRVDIGVEALYRRASRPAVR
jgi:Type II secretion system (T2SS), protein M subtype b